MGSSPPCPETIQSSDDRGSDRLTVLHVDDDPSVLDLAATLFERDGRGFTVRTAASASEGLERLAETDVDCIVSDYDMPGMDGLAFLDAVRAREPELPFVLFTGKGDEQLASDAIASGVTDYVPKHGGAEQYDRLAERVSAAVDEYRAQSRTGSPTLAGSETNDADRPSSGAWHPNADGSGTEAPPRSDDGDETAFFERLVGSVGVGVAAYRSDGTFAYVNDAYADLLGVDRARLENATVREVATELDATAFQTLWESIDEGETRVDETVHSLGERAVPVQTITTCQPIDGTTYHVGTIQDISDRKRHEAALERRTEQLDVINQLLRHDIRNDVQIVMARAELLAEHVDDAGAAHLDILRTKTDHVVELTNTAGHLAKSITHSGVDPDLETIDLAAVLREELQEARAAYDDATIEGPTDLPPVTVRADGLLSSVFGNLLNNAVQHNDAETPVVTVGVTTTDDDVRVRITDNGPGIDAAHRERIFQHGQTGSTSPGTGIGLYLVETLVDQYGGDVWIEAGADDSGTRSERADDAGATFVVELPIATDEVASV